MIKHFRTILKCVYCLEILFIAGNFCTHLRFIHFYFFTNPMFDWKIFCKTQYFFLWIIKENIFGIQLIIWFRFEFFSINYYYYYYYYPLPPRSFPEGEGLLFQIGNQNCALLKSQWKSSIFNQQYLLIYRQRTSIQTDNRLWALCFILIMSFFLNFECVSRVLLCLFFFFFVKK